MINRELEDHLNDFESSLHLFCFEQLGTEEALSLKHSFEVFKNELLYGQIDIDRMENLSLIGQGSVNGMKLRKVNHLVKNLLGYLTVLKKNEDEASQQETIGSIELAAAIILQLTMESSKD